jgi:hypothetical protein
MNLDYITTNEFGEQIISIDPKVGIPTKGKYRFKIKWEQPQNLSDPVKRAYFLVPNIKEWGWSDSDNDPTDSAPAPSFTEVNRSYAFSLDWNDYGDTGTTIGQEMISQAINCDDRFYEFQYNKVYTVSQLIDQYRAGLQSRRIISIKNILDDTCESTNNPFPTNDAVYQPDILFILLSFLFIIIVPIVLVIVFCLHVIAWIVNFIYDIVQEVNDLSDSLGFGEIIDEDPFEQALRRLQMKLNMITYPDCEICECTTSTVPQELTSSVPDPQNNSSYSILANTVDGSQFSNCVTPLLGLPTDNGVRDAAVDQYTNLIAGNNPYNSGTFNTYCPDITNNTTYTGPNLQGGSPEYSNGLFSNNLTLSERLNLFNTKMKYFDNENFGVAPNQIKVTFQTDLNNPTTTFHYDNVFFMLTDESGLQSFTSGKLVSFQDPENKKDINTWRANPSDTDFQVTCITGTPINTGSTLQTISFADPANPTSTAQTTTYNIYQADDDAILHKFPIDIEYFQVITGMTLATFSGLCNPNYATAFPQSLPARFLFNSVSFREVNNTVYGIYNPSGGPDFRYIGPGNIKNGIIGYYGSNYINGDNINPIECLTNYSALTVVFLVRGVDPNTTRVPCSYDLSRLFGYPNYGSTSGGVSLKFEGQFKLNIPIRPGYRIPRHDKVTGNGPGTNTTDILYFTPGVGPQGLFYPSFHFQLGTQFSSFTSNTVAYYSSLDETSMGNTTTSVPSPFYSAFQPYCIGPSTLGPLAGINTNSVTGLRVPNSSNTNKNWFVTDYKPGNVFFSYTYGTTYQVGSVPSNPPNPNGGVIELISATTGNYYIDPTMWVDYTITASTNTANTDNRGYYVNESVEGGTLMTCIMSPGQNGAPVPYDNTSPYSVYVGGRNPSTPANRLSSGEWTQMALQTSTSLGYVARYNQYQPIRNFKFYYFSPSYPYLSTYATYTSGVNIVMRSDRLPTSDILGYDRNLNQTGSIQGNNVFVSQQNPNFAVYLITDDGVVLPTTSASAGGGPNDGSDTEETGSSVINSVLNSLNNCEDSYPLQCYVYDSNQSSIVISQSCINGDTQDYYKNGCYILVRDNYIKSFFDSTNGNPSDINLILEWATRFKINFALCRNVFGHMFTNNWINGTLFAYSFKNDRFFTGPTDTPPNSPYNRFCTDTIILQEPTRNFYYRSSPFRYNATAPQRGEFIGLYNDRRTLGIKHTINSNKVNLLNPTTIIDLGPRNEFIQEYILNDNYDGYYMDKFNPTTFGEVDDILNFFVISRLANSSFIGALLGGIAAGTAGSILSYFSRVPRSTIFPNQKNMVDGDYAQMISINSEAGVAPFDAANYPDAPAGSGDNAMYYNGGDVSDGVIGIFYSSDTQWRDYITPRRVILRSGDPIPPGPLDQDFYYIPVTTQYVPFYDWTKKQNFSSKDSIFGSQRDDWGTDTKYNTGFFANKLQNMDRINTNSPYSIWLTTSVAISDYFMTKDQNKNTFFKGYVYGQKNLGGPAGDEYTALLGDVNTFTINNGDGVEIRYRVGAPFHFYYGLIKGGTAIDLFRTKYIEKDFNNE